MNQKELKPYRFQLITDAGEWITLSCENDLEKYHLAHSELGLTPLKSQSTLVLIIRFIVLLSDDYLIKITFFVFVKAITQFKRTHWLPTRQKLVKKNVMTFAKIVYISPLAKIHISPVVREFQAHSLQSILPINTSIKFN